jgi:thiol-disulfide isomerase/thioredoxin
MKPPRLAPFPCAALAQFAIVGAIFGFTTGPASSLSELLLPSSNAPDFVAVTERGDEIRLSTYRGKVVLIHFWATWCPFSIREMPYLERIRKAVNDEDLVILAVARDDADRFAKFVTGPGRAFRFTFAKDPTGEDDAPIFSHLYKATRLPTDYLISKDGKVIAAYCGYEDGDRNLEKGIQEAGFKLPSSF